MGSWIKCKCDALVHKNLFCGTGISLIASEEFLDEMRPKQTAEELVSEMIKDLPSLLECSNCKRLIVLDEQNNSIKFYELENEAISCSRLPVPGNGQKLAGLVYAPVQCVKH
jgi:hypothetical protein